MEREKTPDEWLEEAKDGLRDLLSWSEELPQELVKRGNPAYQRHKFRSSWFNAVYSDVLLVADILGDDGLKYDLEVFMKAKNERAGQLTTREEIDRANELVKRALAKP